MKSRTLAAALAVTGLAVVLGASSYLLDRLRASAHVVRGLGDAAEPAREESLEVPPEEENAAEDERDVEAAGDAESAQREPVSVDPAPVSGLEVRVVDEAGDAPAFADVLAYRGKELLRAGRTQEKGRARLIPFDGPATLVVELYRRELGRLEIDEGHGRHEVVVTRGAIVGGIARVDGELCEGVWLDLAEGDDERMPGWLRSGLARTGLRDWPHYQRAATQADGSFRFDWLSPQWSGSLRIAEPERYRFANGEERVRLERPEQGLALEIESIHPELLILGRVVRDGQPVEQVSIDEQVKTDSGRDQYQTSTDSLGRFSLDAPAGAVEELRLEFRSSEHWTRRLVLHAPVPRDLGDIELHRSRQISFVTTTEDGAPIEGARGRPRLGSEDLRWRVFAGVMLASEPTDARGHGVLPWSDLESNAFRFSARGYGITDVTLSPDLVEPLEVVLARNAAARVLVRDRSGRIPPGVHVHLDARSGPFTWADGNGPVGDELTLELASSGPWGGKKNEGGAFSCDFPLDRRGEAWIDALHPGAPFDLSVVDGYGSVLACAPGLALESGEWRRLELRVEAQPRTLLVLVRNSAGHPLDGASVQVGTSEEHKMETDRAGMVRTEPLYSDDVTVRVTRYGFVPRTLEHVAVPREGATLEVRLARDWLQW